MKANPAMLFDSEERFRIPPSFTPMPGELIITKKRVSAFTGSDLVVVLRSMDIKHLILGNFDKRNRVVDLTGSCGQGLCADSNR